MQDPKTKPLQLGARPSTYSDGAKPNDRHQVQELLFKLMDFYGETNSPPLRSLAKRLSVVVGAFLLLDRPYTWGGDGTMPWDMRLGTYGKLVHGSMWPVGYEDKGRDCSGLVGELVRATIDPHMPRMSGSAMLRVATMLGAVHPAAHASVGDVYCYPHHVDICVQPGQLTIGAVGSRDELLGAQGGRVKLCKFPVADPKDVVIHLPAFAVPRGTPNPDAVWRARMETAGIWRKT